MMQLTPQMRILLCVAPVDFRAGIDRLCRICRSELLSDPFCGAVFVFKNRKGTAIKLLCYDGQGFWLCQKRLSTGRFQHWPGSLESAKHELLTHQLQVLLWGGDPCATGTPPLWRPIRTPAEAAQPGGS